MNRPFPSLVCSGALVAAAAVATTGLAAEAPPVAKGSAKGPTTEPAHLVEEEEVGLWDRFKISIDTRARYEFVDTDGLGAGDALTLRNRLGLLVGDIGPFSAFAEYEGTLAADRTSANYLSHGDPAKSVVADPESHELNQAWVQYHDHGTIVKAGRQRIILDNARFVGSVGWRQNEQTFDAAAAEVTAVENFRLYYAYVNRTNRIFGSENDAPARQDFEGDSHLVNASFLGIPGATLTGYAYLLDLHNDAGDAASNNTYGARLDGAIPVQEGVKLPYLLEFAYQTDAFDSPLDYGTSYFHGKFGAEYRGHALGVGLEGLLADDGVGFQTPLATGHAFNGFNDTFLNTPPDGLLDLYVYGSAPLPFGIKFSAWFHWFGDDSGSFGYGNEIDAVLAKKLNDHFTVLGKFASYQADNFGADEQLITVEVGFTF
ncbi:alginate export family protein [soil metagenome]